MSEGTSAIPPKADIAAIDRTPVVTGPISVLGRPPGSRNGCRFGRVVSGSLHKDARAQKQQATWWNTANPPVLVI